MSGEPAWGPVVYAVAALTAAEAINIAWRYQVASPGGRDLHDYPVALHADDMRPCHREAGPVWKTRIAIKAVRPLRYDNRAEPWPNWKDEIRAVPGRHPAVKLHLHRYGARRVSLALIQVRPGQPRGAGLAEAALGDLCATADRWAVTVALTPEPLGRGVSRPKLIRWYARHGFVLVPRGPRDGEHDDTMARRPRVAAPPARGA